MNCETVTEKLSAFLDGELGSSDELDVRCHLESCNDCRMQLQQCVAVGDMIRRCECREMQAPAWEALEHNLDRGAMVTRPPANHGVRWYYAALSAAAAFGLIWLAASAFRNAHHDGHAHPSVAVDFQKLFQVAQSDPRAAIDNLVAKYDGRELDRDGTIDYLGYEPALFQALPEGFTRTSTHVLSMPCCKCSATVCQRQDGSSLVVFEHKEEQPVWFGNTPCIETQCAGKPCKIIQSAGNLAVSWKNKDRQLTMVGAKDVREINNWIAALNNGT